MQNKHKNKPHIEQAHRLEIFYFIFKNKTKPELQISTKNIKNISPNLFPWILGDCLGKMSLDGVVGGTGIVLHLATNQCAQPKPLRQPIHTPTNFTSCPDLLDYCTNF
jgi:hypothetical protein